MQKTDILTVSGLTVLYLIWRPRGKKQNDFIKHFSLTIYSSSIESYIEAGEGLYLPKW